jgi:hypothetical protein
MNAVVCTLISLADYLNGWYDKNGLQHHSHWSNTTCDDLVKPIDRELETEKPQARPPQADMIMERCYQ